MTVSAGVRSAKYHRRVPTVHDDAICIRHWDWSETSQTVTLFSRSRGLVRALAKGSRRPKSPYSGGVEMLTRAEAGLLFRPASELALLTEWDLHETFPALRRGLAAFNAGMYFADLIQRFVHDHDPHVGLYDALLAALRGLEVEVLAGVLIFQWAVLHEAGFRPTLGDPEAHADQRTLRFDPLLGGIAPQPSAVEPGAESAWLVRRETVELLRQMASATVADPPSLGEVPMQHLQRGTRLLGAYIRHILGEEPKTQVLVLGHIRL